MYRTFAGLLLCLALLPPLPMQSGEVTEFQEKRGRPDTVEDIHQPTPEQKEMQRRIERARNKERFVRVKKDTDQLLALATDLKKSVDEANDLTLSIDVIRKAEMIEKLAKQVRQKMKGD